MSRIHRRRRCAAPDSLCNTPFVESSTPEFAKKITAGRPRRFASIAGAKEK
jgi:hypothetical protein